MQEIQISMQEGTSLVCRKTGKTGEDHNPDKFAELLLLQGMVFWPRCPKQGIQFMASDRGQNRSLHFVSSELFNPVENCSSRRRVPLFVSSCSSFRRNLA